MTNQLEGTVVMITGASRGLGAALAEAFARAGAKPSLCATSAPALDTVRDRIAAIGGECVAMPCDVRDDAAVEDWLAETTRKLGPPRVLVNNASVLGSRGELRDFDVDEWRSIVDVNLTGTLVVTQPVLEPMLKAGSGSIVNVSSGAAVPPRRNWGAYAVSKSALEALSANLASELEGSGVRVNVVDPGAMRTEMRANAYPDEDPMRLKEPSSIAPLFLWLASPAARGVTGQRFQADEWLGSQR
jgi:NAD(P)-dependent dehydrogenase (short-subunit alcohol dehydrogenase family)